MENPKNHADYQRALEGSLRKYKGFQAVHIATLLLYLGIVVGRPAWALVRGLPWHGERVIPLFLLLVIFFGPVLLLYGWFLWEYHKAIRRLAKGDLLELTGEIVERKGRRYIIRELLPEGIRKSSFQHLTRTHAFHIPKGGAAWEFQTGERVTVFYPASRILWMGMPEAVWLEKKE